MYSWNQNFRFWIRRLHRRYHCEGISHMVFEGNLSQINVGKNVQKKEEWHGGGLSDIVCGSVSTNTNYPDNVEFIQWTHTQILPPSTKLNVIIHKLTEDIHNYDKYEQIYLQKPLAQPVRISYSNVYNMA